MKAAGAEESVCLDVHLQKALAEVLVVVRIGFVRYENRP